MDRGDSLRFACFQIVDKGRHSHHLHITSVTSEQSVRFRLYSLLTVYCKYHNPL